MKAAFESNGTATPEFRASILGEMVRVIASSAEPVPYSNTLYHLMNVSNCKEEEIGGEVLWAWFYLSRLGVIIPDEHGVWKAGTNARPSRLVTDFIWREPTQDFDVEEEGS